MKEIDNLLSQIDLEKLDRIFLERDVDPEDEVTPGWTAGILFTEEEGGTFLGYFGLTPAEAIQHCIGGLNEEGIIRGEE